MVASTGPASDLVRVPSRRAGRPAHVPPGTASRTPTPAAPAATTTVREEDILRQFACGPDPARCVAAAQAFAEAGFDRLVLQNAGPDPDGFLDFYADQLDAPSAPFPWVDAEPADRVCPPDRPRGIGATY